MPVTKASLICSNLRMKPCELSSHFPRDKWEADWTPSLKRHCYIHTFPFSNCGGGESRIISMEAVKGSRGHSFEGYKGRESPSLGISGHPC